MCIWGSIDSISMVYIQHNINYNSEEDKNGLKEVLNKLQGQGTDYETYRSVLWVREDCRISSNDEIEAHLRLLSLGSLTTAYYHETPSDEQFLD